MSWLDKILPPRMQSTEVKKSDVPDGLWMKCPSCDEVLYKSDLEANQYVCPKCDHHLRVKARARIEQLLDADNRVELIEIEIGSTVSLADLSLADFRKKFGDVLVCAIRRKNETLIPSGQDRLLVGDHAYIIGNRATIRKFYRTVCPQKTKINSALVIGGGRLTYYLLDFLKEYRMDIKVIEQSRQTAEELSAAYPNVEVILGDGTDQDVLQQEGIETYNAFISLIGVDEENIIASLYAIQQNVEKVITKVNRELLLKIFDSLGMETIITPKRVIANTILRFVRSLGNSSVSDVEALYRLADNEAEAIQFKVKETSRIIHIPLVKLNTKPNLLIAYIIRNKKLIIPSGQDVIKPNDHVIVVTKEKNYDDIDDIVY